MKKSMTKAVAQSRSRAVASALLLIAGAVGSDRIAAQVIDPPRESYVFHIYVDPMFGDDTRATARNPSTTAPTPPPVPQGPLRPLDRHAEAGSPKPITGFLQHAPYPFKTLTGASGALAWIDANFRPGTGAGTFFPWQHPDSTKERYVTQVVVHCLPGLYGPYSEPSLPRLDPASGLPFNGEVWPARIRDGVSIQGTSALDTVFDARGGFTHVLDVNEDRAINLTNYSHEQSFIDSVTIRGAREREAGPTPGEGAGIYVHARRTVAEGENLSSRVFITNCVITNNVVGIGLDAHAPPLSGGVPARPRILNNTIAWNVCGLWCGNTNSAGPSIHLPILINNIFDSGSPPGNIAGISGFEGVFDGNKQVVSVGGWPLAGSGVDFNAWEVGFVNFGGAIGPGWPAASGTPPPQLSPPRVDVAPFTRTGGTRPGALYINDIFRNSPEGGTGAEYSAHDFRLAPNVSLTTAPPGATVPPLRNPLVNAGLDDWAPQGGTVKYPIVVSGLPGLPLVEPPGLTPGADEARIDGWDWSGEGFGNNRIYLRPGFVPVPYGPPEADFASIIDIGFHELGDLTMAGYLVSSRIYTRMDAAQGGVTLPDRGRVFYFNLIYDGTSYPPTSFPRPRMNAPFGQVYYWWPHVQNGATSDANDGNFTKLVSTQPPPTRYTLINNVGYNSILRSLQCDFTPNLLPDAHPYWGDMMWISSLSPGDIYAANPWYERNVSTPLGTRDNPTLFHNVGGTIHRNVPPPQIPGVFYYTTTGTQDATLNPPGTYLGAGSWLVPPPPPNPPPLPLFGPWSPCLGGTSYTIGTWGYGDAQTGCPDVIPPLSGLGELGVRYNCEVGTPWSNLQTFLAIRSESIPGEGLAAQPRSRLPTAPTKEATLERNREASFWILERFLKRQEKK